MNDNFMDDFSQNDTTTSPAPVASENTQQILQPIAGPNNTPQSELEEEWDSVSLPITPRADIIEDPAQPRPEKDELRVLVCRPDLLRAAIDFIDTKRTMELFGIHRPLLIVAHQMQQRGEGFNPEGFRERLRRKLPPLRRHFKMLDEYASIAEVEELEEIIDKCDAAGIEDIEPREQLLIFKQLILRQAQYETSKPLFDSFDEIDNALANLRDRIDRIIVIGNEMGPLKAAEPADQFVPFPVDLLPESVAQFVRETALSKICDETMVVCPALTILGAAIGTTRKIAVKSDWLEYPIIFSAIIADSGTRKTPVFAAASAPMVFAQQGAHEEYKHAKALYDAKMKRYEAAKKAATSDANPTENSMHIPLAEPQYRHVFTTDTTVEAVSKMLATSERGILILKDELSDFVGSLNQYKKGSNDAAKYLELFNGHHTKTDRKMAEPIFIERAAAWITGTIQPAVFWKCFPDAYAENGFLARFLITFPPRKPEGWSDEVIAPATAEKWSQIVQKLRELNFQPPAGELDEFCENHEPVVVPMIAEARARFAIYCTQTGQEIEAESDPGLKAAWSKMSGYTAKFALIDHLVRQAEVKIDQELPPGATDATVAAQTTGNEDVVDLASVDRAIGLINWFKHETRRIYRMRIQMTSTSDQERSQLLNFIRRKGKVTPREVANNFQRLRGNAKSAKEELDQLVVDGFGRWEPSVSGKGGRATQRFVLRTPGQ